MELNGAAELKNIYQNAIFIYVIPPTQERLLKQMKTRENKRLERNKKQLNNVKDIYDWLIINDDLDTAVEEIQKIMHIVKEFANKYENVDADTMKFLYDRNFYKKENIEFLYDFYNIREQQELEL